MVNYLIFSGIQNSFLVDNPNITFFSKVYKKKSNFYTEPVIQNFNQHFQFDKKISCNISKIGDLLLDTYFYIKFSNIHPILDSENNEIDKNAKFAWVKKLGYALINKIELEIGGNIIETIYGDWLNIEYELSSQQEKNIIDKMIGNLPNLYNFSSSKNELELFIPLNFWFRKSKLALPIIAIKYHDININIILNKKSDICNIGSNRSLEILENIVYFEEKEIIYQKINNKISYGMFINYDIDTNLLYYIKLSNEFLIPSINEKNQNDFNIIGMKSNFEVKVKQYDNMYPKELNINYNINVNEIKLLTNYAHLDISEKIFFERTNHNYLINLLQTSFYSTKINKNLLFKLNFFNNCKSLFWICKLKYNKLIDIYNYTTSIDENNSELLIKTSDIIFNNININKINDSSFFNYIIPMINSKYSTSKGINMYTFCLNDNEIQPNGSINLTKINDINIKLDFNKLISEDIEVLFFNKNYNILKINNGVCSLLFNN